MKKSALIFAAIFSILAIGLVAAQELAAPPIAMNEMLSFLSTIFTGILTPGGTDILSADLFARLLLLIVLIVVLRKPAQLITGEPGTATIIAVIVSILGVRFLTTEMIQGILLPYGTIAIIVSTFIPFILLAYFLISMPYSWVRKIGWIMAAVIFTGLWWMRWTEIGNMAYVYLIVSILSIILFLLDGTIQRWWEVMQLKGKLNTTAYIGVAKIEREMDETMQLLTTTSDKKQVKEIKAKLDKLREQMMNLLKEAKK